jgi:cytochrome c biogenesis protein CcdA
MAELIPILTPLLLVDVLNAVLLAAMIFTAGSARPLANSSALLLGHTIAYLLVGVLALFGVEKLMTRLASHQPVDFMFQLLLGLACFYGAFASRGGRASEEHNPGGELRPLHCLAYGAVINVMGAPFALPYIAAINQILHANLGLDGSLVVLLVYNLAYALPFALVPVLVALMGDEARPLLEKVNGWIARGADFLMPWLLLALGLFLLVDAITYFVTGEPLPVG